MADARSSTTPVPWNDPVQIPELPEKDVNKVVPSCMNMLQSLVHAYYDYFTVLSFSPFVCQIPYDSLSTNDHLKLETDIRWHEACSKHLLLYGTSLQNKQESQQNMKQTGL